MASLNPSERTAYTTPTLLSLKELGATDAGPFANTKSRRSYFSYNVSQLLRSAILLIGAGVSAATASAGTLVIIYLVATHRLTPRQLRYTRELPLDIAGHDLISRTSLLSDSKSQPRMDSKLPRNPDARFFPPGERVDVWVDLTIPNIHDRDRDGRNMAHVVGELTAGDGRVAARATQPVLLRSSHSALLNTLSAPLQWVGLLSSDHTVKIRLFADYRELHDTPFVGFKLAVKPRTHFGPDVLGASLRIQLQVGFFRRFLFYLRPHSLMALALAAGALAAVVGGSTGTLLCFVLLGYTIALSGRRAPAVADAPSPASDASSELLAGVPSVESTPRDIGVSDDDNDESVGIASPISPPSPVEGRPWQKTLKQLPMQGWAAPGDDTPFLGSEAELSGSASAATSDLRFRRGMPAKVK